MKILKNIFVAISVTLASFNACAGVITAGGITWDESPGGDMSADFQIQQWFALPSSYGIGLDGQFILVDDSAFPHDPSSELAGVGEFSEFSDGRGAIFGAPVFCAACELTFSFGGLIPESASGEDIIFNTDNSWLNIYIDTTSTLSFPGGPYRNFNNYTALSSDSHNDFTDAQDGTLWGEFKFDSFTLGPIDLSSRATFGQLSIVGGLTDVVDYFTGKEVEMTSRLSFPGESYYSDIAIGEFTSSSISEVPEPSTMAIFTLGLMGLGLRQFKK